MAVSPIGRVGFVIVRRSYLYHNTWDAFRDLFVPRDADAGAELVVVVRLYVFTVVYCEFSPPPAQTEPLAQLRVSWPGRLADSTRLVRQHSSGTASSTSSNGSTVACRSVGPVFLSMRLIIVAHSDAARRLHRVRV